MGCIPTDPIKVVILTPRGFMLSNTATVRRLCVVVLTFPQLPIVTRHVMGGDAAGSEEQKDGG